MATSTKNTVVNDGGSGKSSTTTAKSTTTTAKTTTASTKTTVANSTSVVDTIKALGGDSSYAARAEIAADLGIKNYTGTAAQNTQLNNAIKKDPTIITGDTTPAKSTPAKSTPAKSTPAKSTPAKSTAVTNQKSSSVKADVNNIVGNPAIYGDYLSGYNGSGSVTNGNAGNAGIGSMLSLGDQLQALYNSVPELKNDYTRPAYVDVTDPRLQTAMELANQFGISYDKNAIMGVYQNAVDKAYDVRYNQQAQTEAGYYDNIAALQNTTLDSLRQQQAQAIQVGTNKGMQAANQLSAVLGVSQAAMQSANEIAQSRAGIAQEQSAAQAQASTDALKYYDSLGTSLGDIAKQLYSYEVQQQAAQLGYNQGINTDYAGVMAQNQAAQAAIAQALANGASSITSNYTSTLGSLEQARINAAAQQAVAQANAQASKYAADTAAAAQVAAAAKSAAAYASGYTPYNSSAYTATGSTGAASTSAAAATSYMNKIQQMADNGAPASVIQEAINSGVSSGVLTQNDLKQQGNYNTWTDYYANQAANNVTPLITLPAAIGATLTAPVPKASTTTTTPKASTTTKTTTKVPTGSKNTTSIY